MGTIIKLLTTLNELEEKTVSISICELYYLKVSKRNNENFLIDLQISPQILKKI